VKLHDLRPADGSRTLRTRVGRGIAAGKGKTAGRGTKGQKARAGGSIPPWFEGGQTPLHMRIPKLRGFKNRFKVEYEVVNIGRIGEAAAQGAFDAGDEPGTGKSAKDAPATVNQEILRAVGLVRRLDRPMKILGHGDIDAALFVVADSFSKSARAKIEAAGGSVQLLVIPTEPLAALGVEATEAPSRPVKARAKSTETKAAAKAAAQPVAAAEPAAADEPVAAVEPVAADEPVAPVEPAAAAEPDAVAEAPADARTDGDGPPPTRAPAARAAKAKPAKPARAAKAAGTRSKADDGGSDADVAPASVDRDADAPAAVTDDDPAAKDA
jgi:large subunit ribosomal protein L15